MHWLVGDLQGCAHEFEDLLKLIQFDPSRDKVWCVGDLINRGPYSLETLRLWRDIGGYGVIGNHDVYGLLTFNGTWPRKRDSLQALFDAPDGSELLNRLRALPLLAKIKSDEAEKMVWAVHGGMHPSWTDLDKISREIEAEEHDEEWLQRPEVSYATRLRCCTPSGEAISFDGTPEDCPKGAAAWDHWYAGSLKVVHGHWARRGAYQNERTVGLDSGCVYGGPLSAWSVEDERIVQVPCRNATGYWK